MVTPVAQRLPAGPRIRVQALNPAGKGGSAGHAPLLSVDQLTKIAASAQWSAAAAK